MATKIETLKGWFGSRKYPTGAQFAAWLDSFWHKDEQVPMASVEGIAEALNSKWDTSSGDALTVNVNNKIDKWLSVLPECYFIHANYKWCRVSFISDNGYYAPGYQEQDTFDIDVKALVEQYYSTGNPNYTIMRVIGANASNPSENWKIVRYNIVVNAATMYIKINDPSSYTFTTKIYVQR